MCRDLKLMCFYSFIKPYLSTRDSRDYIRSPRVTLLVRVNKLLINDSWTLSLSSDQPHRRIGVK